MTHLLSKKNAQVLKVDIIIKVFVMCRKSLVVHHNWTMLHSKNHIHKKLILRYRCLKLTCVFFSDHVGTQNVWKFCEQIEKCFAEFKVDKELFCISRVIGKIMGLSPFQGVLRLGYHCLLLRLLTISWHKLKLILMGMEVHITPK